MEAWFCANGWTIYWIGILVSFAITAIYGGVFLALAEEKNKKTDAGDFSVTAMILLIGAMVWPFALFCIIFLFLPYLITKKYSSKIANFFE